MNIQRSESTERLLFCGEESTPNSIIPNGKLYSSHENEQGANKARLLQQYENCFSEDGFDEELLQHNLRAENPLHNYAERSYGSILQDSGTSDDIKPTTGSDDNTNISSANSSESDSSDVSSNPKRDWKRFIIGHTILLFCLLAYTLAVITSQIATEKSNIFELNTIRFAIQTSISALALIPQKCNLAISKKYFLYFVGVTLLDYVYSTCYFLAASFMPVGNMDGIFSAVYIIVTTIIDLWNKTVSKISVVASSIACAGIVMIVQPWELEHHRAAQKVIPCDYMDNQTGINLTDTFAATEIGKTEVVHTIEGYIFITAAAIAVSFSGNILRALLKVYSLAAVTFWNGLFEGFISLIVIFVWNMTTGDSYALPSGFYCLIFTFLFTLFSAVQDLLSYWSYVYLPISKVALAMPFCTVMLYISQRTFLKMFHPGNADIIEIIGIIFIFVGGTLSPIITIAFENKMKEK